MAKSTLPPIRPFDADGVTPANLENYRLLYPEREGPETGELPAPDPKLDVCQRAYWWLGKRLPPSLFRNLFTQIKLLPVRYQYPDALPPDMPRDDVEESLRNALWRIGCDYLTGIATAAEWQEFSRLLDALDAAASPPPARPTRPREDNGEARSAESSVPGLVEDDRAWRAALWEQISQWVEKHVTRSSFRHFLAATALPRLRFMDPGSPYLTNQLNLGTDESLREVIWRLLPGYLDDAGIALGPAEMQEFTALLEALDTPAPVQPAPQQCAQRAEHAPPTAPNTKRQPGRPQGGNGLKTACEIYPHLTPDEYAAPAKAFPRLSKLLGLALPGKGADDKNKRDWLVKALRRVIADPTLCARS